MGDERYVEIYNCGEWVKASFEELKIGDRFRLYESTGELVIGENGQIEWFCTSKPYLNINNILTVNVE